jgi:hypothetical protein
MLQHAGLKWRWAIPFYIIPIPFIGLVVYSAWQVLQGAGPQSALISIGHAHLKQTLIWAGVSLLSFVVAWRLDQSQLASDATPSAPPTPTLPPFEAIEEPTMILHAQTKEISPTLTPSSSTDGEGKDNGVEDQAEVSKEDEMIAGDEESVS